MILERLLELTGNKYLMQVYCLKVSFELLVAWSSTRAWLHFCDLEESRKYNQNHIRETYEGYTELF